MKKTRLTLLAFLVISFYACKKDADKNSTTLTASTTQATVGEPVTFTVISKNNTGNWTVSPATNVTKTFTISTSKVNYVTFNQAGNYTVSVMTRNLLCDSTGNHSLDSCWVHKPGNGNCNNGHHGHHGNDDDADDSASVHIVVKGK